MTAGERRVRDLQRRMTDEGIGLFVFNDADSIFYFAEAHDYLGMEFARATILDRPRRRRPFAHYTSNGSPHAPGNDLAR